MDDYIHWDDSDLDLDALLGDYTDYDVGCVSGDAWSDDEKDIRSSEVVSPKDRQKKTKKTHRKENSKAEYICPLCHKAYKSIMGFRGHVTKKHGRSDIKAHEHRSDGPNHKQPAEIPPAKVSSVPVACTEQVKEALKVVVPKAVELIILDPMFDGSCSIHGPNIVRIGKELLENTDVQIKLGSILEQRCINVMSHFGQGCSLSSDREELWRKYHQMATDRQFTSNLRDFIREISHETPKMIHMFTQCFLSRVIRHMIEFVTESLRKLSEKADSQLTSFISENDQSVLFYISGYLVHAVCQKKVVSGSDVEPYLANLETAGDSSEKFIQKFRTWTEKINRGGLKIPSDNFFLLVRTMETVIRDQVQLSDLCASSLKCDKLKETILTNFMVSFYWDKLLMCIDEIKLKLLEFIVTLFLRVRGGAVAKFARRQSQKKRKDDKKTHTGKGSKSLRGTLKSLENKNE